MKLKAILNRETKDEREFMLLEDLTVLFFVGFRGRIENVMEKIFENVATKLML